MKKKYKTIRLTEKQVFNFEQAAEVFYEEYGDECILKEQLRLLGIKYDPNSLFC